MGSEKVRPKGKQDGPGRFLAAFSKMGKWILMSGVVLVVIGAVVWLLESLGLPLGRLPGDIRMSGQGWSFSVPIVTCIIISIVLTVLMNLFFRR